MSTQRKSIRGMEEEQDETTAKKNFAALPAKLRELILSKTDTDTRLKLFQINNELREWVLKEELFGEDLEQIDIWKILGAAEDESQLWITPRYGSARKIDAFNQYIFKVVRRCRRLFFGDEDLDLTRVFPRLQSINHFGFFGTNFTRLSQMFMDSVIEVTGYCCLDRTDMEEMKRNIDENFFQFIENHLKRCKPFYLKKYSLEKLFDFLGTQRFPQTIFEYWGALCDGDFDFEKDLKMILGNGIPSLHPDSAIWMIIQSYRTGELMRIFNLISEKTGMVMENEAIRNKFLASYEKVGGWWVDGYLTSDPSDSDAECHYIGHSDFEFFGLKRKFDDKRNLIFLVYLTKDAIEPNINIHIKFDPIEE